MKIKTNQQNAAESSTTEANPTSSNMEGAQTVSSGQETATRANDETVDQGVYSNADQWEDYAEELLNDPEDETVAEAEETPVQKTESEQTTEETAEAEESEEDDVTVEAEDAEQPTDSTAEAETSEEETPEIDYDKIRQLLKQKQEKKDETVVEETPTAETSEETVSYEERMAQAREAVNTELEKEFQLSDDEIELLRDDPNQVLPKMMSKMFMRTFESLISGVQSQLPQQIAQIVNLQQRSAEGTQAFYTVWPQLRGKEKVVDRIADVYAANNPGVSREQAIMEIGAQAWIANKMSLAELQAHIDKISPPPAPQPVPVSQHRAPATPGKAASTRVAPAARSEFEILAEEFLDEDAS